MASNNVIWDAAEFLTEWDGPEYWYKLLRVPRTAIDEDSDESDAYLLIGLDSGNVRRVDVLLDTAYERELYRDVKDAVRAALVNAPEDARTILADYI